MSNFNQALSAALFNSRPPLPPNALVGKQQEVISPEEELEELEQKITLTLQSIDANFDHCQRTMSREVMPKVEALAKVSSHLLEASQPWLQFFMAVAGSSDDDVPLEPAPVEETAAEITARFPPTEADTMDMEDVEEDVDVEIATPQLTSRFMTEELVRKRETPQGLKRSVEDSVSGSAKRLRVDRTPRANRERESKDNTPVLLMRELVKRGAGSVVSHNSMDTDDLMPQGSPLRTTTFTLPKSRRALKNRVVGPPSVEDEDDVMSELNGLIRRYDSPSKRSMQSSVAKSSVGSELVNKYREVESERQVRGLVADMEEMLGAASEDIPSPPELTTRLSEPLRTEEPPVAARRTRHQPRRTFGEARTIFRMGLEEMDTEDLTISRMSPLTYRAHQQQHAEPPRFQAIAEDEEDPFGLQEATPVNQQPRMPPMSGTTIRGLRSGNTTVLGSDATAVRRRDVGASENESSMTFDYPASFDGTTTILPTREMLQQAAAQVAQEDNSDEEEELVDEFRLDLFPAQFQEEPAALRLRALYELVVGEREKLWCLEGLLEKASDTEETGGLRSAGEGVVVVLLDLLVRKRLIRKAADNLWTGK